MKSETAKDSERNFLFFCLQTMDSPKDSLVLPSPTASLFQKSMTALVSVFKESIKKEAISDSSNPQMSENVKILNSPDPSYSYIVGSFLEGIEGLSPNPMSPLEKPKERLAIGSVDYNKNMLLLEDPNADSQQRYGLRQRNSPRQSPRSTTIKRKVIERDFDPDLDGDMDADEYSTEEDSDSSSHEFRCHFAKCKTKNFASEKQLKMHLQTAHPHQTSSKQFKCSLCPQTFSRSHGTFFHSHLFFRFKASLLYPFG